MSEELGTLLQVVIYFQNGRVVLRREDIDNMLKAKEALDMIQNAKQIAESLHGL